MKTFDELLAMSEEERESYRRDEAEKIIISATPHHQLRLRALQAKIDGIHRRIKSPLAAASQMYGLMTDSLLELNEALAPFRSNQP